MGLVKAILARYPEARLMVMIRPRIGSFVYSETDLGVMEQDVGAFKKAGVMGVVFGCLTQEGDIDKAACQRLARAAHLLEITFHRAIDVCNDLEKAFMDITEIDGVTRILSSGRAESAILGIEGLKTLSRLSEVHASGTGRKVIILPGSGVNASNARGFLDGVPSIQELHLTGSSVVEGSGGAAGKKGHEMGFGDDKKWELNRGKVEAVWKIMQGL